MKHVIKIQLVLVVIILLIAAIKAWGLEPPPLPDVPFSYDPNLCLSPVMDWCVVEPGESWTYTVYYWSHAGVDVELVTSDPNLYALRVEKTHMPPYWRQTFTIMFTYFDDGVHYLDLQAKLANGRVMDRRTLLVCVEQGFLYPPTTPVISDAGWSQQVVQRAHKEDNDLKKNVIRWN